MLCFPWLQKLPIVTFIDVPPFSALNPDLLSLIIKAHYPPTNLAISILIHSVIQQN